MSLFPILMLVVIGAAFWFLVLRPARSRQQQQASLIQSLAVGQEVMTTAGLFGTVTGIDGDKVILEIADGVHVRYLNLAIAKVVDPVELDSAPLVESDETVTVSDVRESPSKTSQ